MVSDVISIRFVPQVCILKYTRNNNVVLAARISSLDTKTRKRYRRNSQQRYFFSPNVLEPPLAQPLSSPNVVEPSLGFKAMDKIGVIDTLNITMNVTNVTDTRLLFPPFHHNILIDTTNDLIIGVVVLVLVVLCTFACCVTMAKKCSIERRTEYQPSEQYYTKVPTNVRRPVTEV